jgi:hypothetical protein
MTIPKLSTQKDALKQANAIIKKILTSSEEVEKVNMTCEVNNGRLVTRFEIISRIHNAQ